MYTPRCRKAFLRTETRSICCVEWRVNCNEITMHYMQIKRCLRWARRACFEFAVEQMYFCCVSMSWSIRFSIAVLTWEQCVRWRARSVSHGPLFESIVTNKQCGVYSEAQTSESMLRISFQPGNLSNVKLFHISVIINIPLVSQTRLKPSPRLKCKSEVFQLK